MALLREERAVWALALGQMLGYACFFYIFAALVLVWQQELDWGAGVIAAGPLVSISMAAVLSPLVGRWVDQGFALRLMTLGTVLGAGALALLALAWHPVAYLLAFAGLGSAASMTLYEVCFALMIRRFGPEARGAITRVTLVAGLASTLAFPAGAWLAADHGWRGAVWVAVVAVLGVMLPLQAWGAFVLGGGRPRGAAPTVRAARWADLIRRPGAVGLMGLFALLNLDHWMILGLLRPMLDSLGVAEGPAVLAAALIGPAQVLGRLALMAAGDRLASRRASLWTVLAMVAGAVFLLAQGLGLWTVFAFAAVQGAAMGVLTILKPLLVAEVNGPQDYAAASAAISLPAVAATAIAPAVGTALMAIGGPMLLLWAALGLSLGALALVLRLGTGGRG
jgi:predicted MFS family arabinose efflux permease